MKAEVGLPAESAVRGIIAIVLAMAIFSAMDVVVKILRETYSANQIFFFRSLFALFPCMILIRLGGGLAALRTSRMGIHIFRSLLNVAFTLCFFFALRELPLADAYTIIFAAPLFITALSVPILGERVGPRRWAAVLVGFVGILVVLRPDGAVMSIAGLVTLFGTVIYAVAMLLVRRMSRTETQASIVFYFLVISILVSGLFLPFGWTNPTPADFGLFVLIGVVGGLGQILATRAYSIAPPATVGPFQYSQMIWGVAYGYLIFSDLPSPAVVAGATIVIASGLYIVHRETVRGAQTAPHNTRLGG